MPEHSDESRAWRLALWLVGALTMLRLAVLFITPLELYPDEAQYWLWSRTLDFGYFSKPPMIAWLIAGTTSLGNEEPFVRLAAPFLHAGAALALQVSRIVEVRPFSRDAGVSSIRCDSNDATARFAPIPTWGSAPTPEALLLRPYAR